jgi:hypothetical protein
MDFFTQLEKKIMSTVPKSEEYERLIAGLALALNVSEQSIEIALDGTFHAINDQQFMGEYYGDELDHDFQRFDMNVDEAMDFIYSLLYFFAFPIYKIDERFKTEEELYNALLDQFNVLYKQYIEVYQVREAIQFNNRPSNVIPFKQRGSDEQNH